MLPKLIDAIVVNNIEQYVVAASFFAANYLLVAKLIVAPVYVFVAIVYYNELISDVIGSIAM